MNNTVFSGDASPRLKFFRLKRLSKIYEVKKQFYCIHLIWSTVSYNKLIYVIQNFPFCKVNTKNYFQNDFITIFGSGRIIFLYVKSVKSQSKKNRLKCLSKIFVSISPRCGKKSSSPPPSMWVTSCDKKLSLFTFYVKAYIPCFKQSGSVANCSWLW